LQTNASLLKKLQFLYFYNSKEVKQELLQKKTLKKAIVTGPKE